MQERSCLHRFFTDEMHLGKDLETDGIERIELDCSRGAAKSGIEIAGFAVVRSQVGVCGRVLRVGLQFELVQSDRIVEVSPAIPLDGQIVEFQWVLETFWSTARPKEARAAVWRPRLTKASPSIA